MRRIVARYADDRNFVAGDSPAETADQAALFAEAGAEHLCLYFLDNSRPDLLGPTAEAVAAATGGVSRKGGQK